MKTKTLGLTTALAALAALAATLSPLPAQTISVFDEIGFPTDLETSPAIVEGDLGQLEELEFRPGDPDSETEWADYIEIPVPEGEYNEFTIALFLKPERPQANETLVGDKLDTGKTGFRLQKSWNKWLVDVGDGTQDAKFMIENLDGDLLMNEWQHLAVTFRDGEVRCYKDGLLVYKKTLPVKTVLLKKPLRVGAGLGGAYAFAGRLGGIYVEMKALDDDAIHDLMQKANP